MSKGTKEFLNDISIRGLVANNSLGNNNQILTSNGSVVYWEDNQSGEMGARGFTGSRGDTGFAGGLGFTGSRGDIGAKGNQGFTGSRGTTGFTGSQGIQGIQGVQGPQGLTGSRGEMGFTGSASTVQGPQGFSGSQGIQGVQGTVGFTGSRGTTGFSGSAGLNGSQGTTGFTGSRGATGTTGNVGFTGSGGSTGFTGSRGADGSQGTTGFTGSRGTTGFSGSQGIQGVTGFTGSQGSPDTPAQVLSKLLTVDGSGSGLDADLWDGNQFSTFINQEIKYTSDVVFNSIQVSLSSFAPKMLYDVSANASNPFDGGLRPVIFGAGFGSIGIIPRTGTTGTNIWLFSGSGTLAQTVPFNGVVDFPVGARIQNNNIWHAGNDGSGSGLDADLWDGNQFSTFINQGLRTDANVQFNLLSFPPATAQKINLFSGAYGIGVQGSTQYYRSASRFSWHKGGSHSGAENNPGTGGTVQMTIDGNANLTVTGEVISSFSDIRLKNDLGPIENVKDILTSLRGFYFEANSIAENLGYTRKREIGLSAQDVNKVLPELIGTNGANSKYMTVKYDRIVPVLIEGFKLQQNEIEDLKSTIESLKSSIENL